MFALGTAQLGKPYGIANRTGLPETETVFRLFDRARRAGIGWLDTAQDYGAAESRIGAYLSGPGAGWPVRLVTKLSMGLDHADRTGVRRAMDDSLESLGRTPDVLLVHSQAAIGNWSGGIRDTFVELRDAGKTGRIGFSTYTPEQFRIGTEAEEVDVIQAPLNVLDRRLADSGLIDEALARGKTLFARSLFLQGLLLMDSDAIPGRLRHAVAAVGAFAEVCSAHRLAPFAAAIGFVRDGWPQVTPILGCETEAQFQADLDAWEAPLPATAFAALTALPQADETVVNPALWPREEPAS